VKQMTTTHVRAHQRSANLNDPSMKRDETHSTLRKYELVVDDGKPSTETILGDEELKTRLQGLKRLAESGDYPYFDVNIYDEKDNDITTETFKKYGFED
jgi:hypothetical protein